MIGTPYGLTIDEQTLADDTVTWSATATRWHRSGIPIGGARQKVAELLAADWRSPKTA
jgi:glycyl-tRNA synthetase (class II)